MTFDPDLEELIAGYLAEALEPHELAQLEARLASDPAARERFARHCDEDLALRQALSYASAAERRSKTRRTSWRRQLRTSSSSLAPIAMAAGLLVGFIIVLTLALVSPDLTSPGTVVRNDPRPEPAPREPQVAPTPKPEPAKHVPKVRPSIPDGKPVPALPGLERTPPPSRVSPPPPVRNPAPAPPRKPPSPAPPPKTTVAVATVEAVEGDVRLVSPGGARPATKGAAVTAAQRVETGEASRAALSFPDGTRLEVGSVTSIFRLAEQSNDRGKRIEILRGVLTADVARQPIGRPMIFSTPQAEATVLGTTLRLVVAPGAANGSTRLEVREGRVRLKRARDGKSVQVTSGHYAVSGEGVPLASRRLTPNALFAEDFETTPEGSLPGGFRAGRPGQWSVRRTQGNAFLEGGGKRTSLLFGDPAWRHYEVSVRARFDAMPSVLGIIVRHDPASGKNYQLELTPKGARLVRSLGGGTDDPNQVVGAKGKLAAGTWYRIRAVCRGENIQLWVDGRLVLQSREKNSPTGFCKLYIDAGRAQFDDLVVKPLKQ